MAKKTISKKVMKTVKDYLELLTDNGITIKQAYVFGSYAKGTVHSGSDIDVCIVSNNITSWSDSISLLNHLKGHNKEFIDIEGHGFNTKDFNNRYLSLPVEIKKTGIRIV